MWKRTILLIKKQLFYITRKIIEKTIYVRPPNTIQRRTDKYICLPIFTGIEYIHI